MRKPDFIVLGQGTPQKPYLMRWWLIPRNRWFNVYLHKFEHSDDDRAEHDHPWCSLSICLKGQMIEHSWGKTRVIKRWWPYFRKAEHAHRLELIRGPVWTLFFTGPKVREWGFYMQPGAWWVHWATFEALYKNQGNVIELDRTQKTTKH